MSLRHLLLAGVLPVLAASPICAQDATAPAPVPAAQTAAAELVKQLEDGDVATRRRAVYALWKLGGDAKDAATPIARAMLDEDTYVRTTAARAILKHAANLGAAAAVLGKVLTDGAADVRVDAAKALWQAGQTGGSAGLPLDALGRALEDTDPEVRANAAAAFEWSGERGRGAVDALLVHAVSDEDERVRNWAARSVGSIDGGKLVEPMVAKLSSTDAATRRAACATLGYGGGGAKAAAPALARALADPDVETRVAAAAALGAVGPQSVIEHVLAALDDPSTAVRDAALAALNQPGSAAMEPAVPRLIALLDHDSSSVRANAASALGSIDPDPAVLRFAAMIVRDRDATVRTMAAYCLANMGNRLPDVAVRAVINAADDEEGSIRIAALNTLGGLGRRAASAAPAVLRRAQAADDPFGRQIALATLVRIGVDVDQSLVAMRDALDADEPMVRIAAAQALGQLGAAAAPAASALAQRVLTDDDVNVRTSSAMALAEIGPRVREAASALGKLGDDAPFLLRTHVAFALARTAPDAAAPQVERLISLIGGDEFLGMVPVTNLGRLGAAALPAQDRLRTMLRTGDTQSWYAAALALVRIGGDGAKEALDDVVRRATTKGTTEDRTRRASAIRIVSAMPQHAARFVPFLVAMIESTEEEDVASRTWAAQALGSCGAAAASAVPALMRMKRDPDPAVRHAAESALIDIVGR